MLPPVRPNSGTPEGLALLSAPAAAGYFSTPAGVATGAGVGLLTAPYLTAGTQRAVSGAMANRNMISPLFRAYGRGVGLAPVGLLDQ